MTLKGHKSHYNIKLRGYGISINLQDNKIILKNGQNDITGESVKEEWFVTKIPYEKIVISGKDYVSTEAISLLNQNNINVILTDTYGNPLSFMNGGMISNTAIKYRMGQYDTFRNPDKVLQLQKWLLKEKIQSQINFLKSLEKPELQDGVYKLKATYNNIIDEITVGVTGISQTTDTQTQSDDIADETPALVSTYPLSFSLDKTSYTQGDIVWVTGKGEPNKSVVLKMTVLTMRNRQQIQLH